jgi:hypothetical protein
MDEESDEFWKLRTIDQESFLEMSSPIFGEVIDRLERKGSDSNSDPIEKFE